VIDEVVSLDEGGLAGKHHEGRKNRLELVVFSMNRLEDWRRLTEEDMSSQG
jgi:hypothetical protein